MKDPKIQSMDQITTLTIRCLYRNTLWDEIDTKNELSPSMNNHIANTIWLVLRQLKTEDQLDPQFSQSYHQQPFVLTTQGYRLIKPFPQYVQLDQSYFDVFSNRTIKLIDYLNANLNLPIRDPFYIDHKHQLPQHALTKFWHAMFNPVNIPVNIKAIPALTNDDYRAVEHASYQTKLPEFNFSRRLFAHIQATLADQSLNQQQLLVISLLTASYIRRHHNQYASMDCGTDLEYSPYRPIGGNLVFSSSKPGKWPNRWFRIVKLWDSYRVENPSINNMLNKYPHEHGQTLAEFQPYDLIIHHIAQLADKDLQTILRQAYQPWRQKDHATAIDWDDLKEMDKLPFEQY